MIEKEALALIWALQNFEVYVGSVSDPLVVYTDHNPLIYLHSLRCPNQRLTRWCLFLQSYALDIRHIKGTDNVVADALSSHLYLYSAFNNTDCVKALNSIKLEDSVSNV